MRSGQPLGISQNKPLPGGRLRRDLATDLIRLTLGGLLTATGFIHWYLPVVHRMEMPGELTGGIIVIPHLLLHILFDLNGAGYFVLVALTMGWLLVSARRQMWLYRAEVGYTALTILAWMLLSEPAERGLLDYADKLIEVFVVVLAIWMARRLAATTDVRPGNCLQHITEKS